MMILLHPTYTLRISVHDRPQDQSLSGVMGNLNNAPPRVPFKFYDSTAGKIGCDQVLKAVGDALRSAGIAAGVFFEKFEHTT